MKKIAFFVEGQTEQIFLKRLVREVLGIQHVTVLLKKLRGGTHMPRQETVVHRIVAKDPKYTVLICDCGADNKVKSEVLDQLASLRASGFSSVVGMRDLYPMPVQTLSKLERGMKFLPDEFLPLKSLFNFIVVIQEVETWFLAEPHHLLRLDSRLTGDYIKSHLGFDPVKDSAEERHHPADDLDRIYRLVGKTYTKKEWQTDRLVDNMDMDYLLSKVRKDIPSLNELVSVLEQVKN